MRVVVVNDTSLSTIGVYTGPFEEGYELEFNEEEYASEEIQRLLERNLIKDKD